MAEIVSKIDRTLPGFRSRDLLEHSAVILSVVAVLSSALHFWPFQGNRFWEVFVPANSAVIIWTCLLTLHCLLLKDASASFKHLPRTSVLSFLSVGVLSLAATPDVSRTGTYVGKLLLTYLGAYTLFRYAGRSRRGRRILQMTVCAALVIAVTFCLTDRIVRGAATYGFFEDAHKYGSYVAILCPICIGVFLTERISWWKSALVSVLVAATAASLGTLGGMIALGTGLLACLVLARGTRAKFSVALIAACAVITVGLMLGSGLGNALRRDMSLMETKGENCRQRYLEWQALINLLEERADVGTGAGSVNTFRSMYYYRLPKLNTMSSFEQNGWLTAAAGTGVLGLICFCWVVSDYVQAGLRNISLPKEFSGQGVIEGVGPLAGLCAACAANVFSSVQYNGVLIVFVLVLALIARPEGVGDSHECSVPMAS